jgi:hypothetical protein
MRLVHASYKREIFAVVLVAALGLIVCLIASGAPDADARPRTATAVIPDGTYGVNKAARGEYVVFTVRNRRVYGLEFQIQIDCQTSDSPGSEPRFFSAGARAPRGHLIPSNGRMALSWEERGGGRLGEIEVVLKFGARDVAHAVVIVPEESGPEAAPEEAKEYCDGDSELHFHRGYELPPIPSP